MKCKIDHNDSDCTIPQFLCRVCNPPKAAASGQRLVAAEWVDPVEQRQREIRAARAATDKAKREAALAKHLRKIEDEHPGEEWDRKNKMWIRTARSMAKYEAKLRAEFEAAA